MDSDSFPDSRVPLYMLGVRRSSGREVAATLQRSGLINYHRGQIAIRGLKGLEVAACECYHSAKQEFKRLLD